MKKKFFLLMSFQLILSFTSVAQNRKEFPIIFQHGYGNIISSMTSVDSNTNDKNNPWFECNIYASNIPNDWKEVKTGKIVIDPYQFAYQLYYANKITKEWYLQLQKGWRWTPDHAQLCKNPIRCYVAYAYGYNRAGILMMIIDKNNNMDFSDDKPFIPRELTFGERSEDKDILDINYETYINNKIESRKIGVTLRYNSKMKRLFAGFAGYYTFNLNGKAFAIVSTRFIDQAYIDINVIPVDEMESSPIEINSNLYPAKNDILKVGSDSYRIIGLNTNKGVFILDKVKSTKHITSITRIGYKFPEFKAKEFSTQKEIVLSQYKGKYLLIDFWATWCKPCLEDMPALKNIYENTDRNQLEIIAIVGDSKSENIKKTIDKYDINWPLIESDDSNDLIYKYNIYRYPTTFLIDPNGSIIAKDIRPSELLEKLAEIMIK